MVTASVCAVLAAVLTVARCASAHPAGFASINRYIGVRCGADGRAAIAYLLDFAELPAYTELDQLDADHDGTVTPAEQRAYLDRRLPPIVAAWAVWVGGVRATPRVTGSSLEVLPGERGLSTLRIAADVALDHVPPGDLSRGDVHVEVRDRGFSDYSGWREMAGEDSAGTVVVSGEAARPEDALTYAPARRAKPPRIDEARFAFRRRTGSGISSPPLRPAPIVVIDARLSRLSRVIKEASGSASFTLLALALALALGAAHALSPGHGKALAGAYLVGHRARPSQAVLFGGAVTVAHTAVVFVIGCLAVAFEHTVGSDRLLRGLEALSAVAVLLLGVVQLSGRWREAANGIARHDHAHERAIASSSARPDGAGSLIALGASAGLTPCPSALALLLAAIAMHHVVFGLVLVLAFSAGVAVTLMATGLVFVLARQVLDRVRWAGPALRWLPVASSVCVLTLGALLCASALG